MKDTKDTHDVYEVKPAEIARENGHPGCPFFIGYERGDMVPTIVESKNGRVSRKYALLMDSIGQLRLVQIKDSEVAKYAGWDQTR